MNSEHWKEEISFISVIQNLMNMYSRGEDKQIIFDKLLKHIVVLTDSRNGLISKLINKDGQKFHHIVSYISDEKVSEGMMNFIQDKGGYYITDNENSLLHKTYICTDDYLIDNDCFIDTTKNSRMPEDHFTIKRFFGVPLKHCGETYGIVCLTGKNSIYTKTVFDKIEPFLEICNLLLHSYNVSALESIYKRIVQNLDVPITVYQGSVPFNTSGDVTSILSDYRCIIVNKSFCKRACPPDKEVIVQLQNRTLFDSFPNFKAYQELLDAILLTFRSKDSQTIECISYEDYLLSKSQYQFRFCYVDDQTFIMSIDDISDDIRAKQVADNIVKSKEEFIANISHEMRTPLNGIIGYTALIMDTTLNEYQKDCFATIKECSMNLLYRVNDLLDLSKLTAGKMEIMEEDFSLPDCISASYDVNSLDAKQKNIEMSYFIEPDVPNNIRSDSHKLQQILVNLLNNAIKFTDRGKINTHVRIIDDPITGQKLDARRRYTIEFSVSDTGVGIREEDFEKLFIPFNQLHDVNSESSGTGLGLVITKKLCELLGGDIKAESIYGRGSKFTFQIKAQGNDVRTFNNDEEESLLRHKKILVVDDNEINRVMICSFLSEWKAIPISCSSAKEALFYVEKGIIKFDLALLDIRMPHKDGNELAMNISQVCPDLPLVALSSIPLPPDQINKNFRYYLTKPIKCKKLKSICIDIFYGKRDNNNINSDENSESDDNIVNNLRKKVVFNNDVGVMDSQSPPSNKYFRIPKVSELDRRHTNARIVIAEDMYINQKVIMQILHKLKYKNVDLAENGKVLLDMIKSQSFDYDIILMDLKMPVMDGFEAALQINKLYQSQMYRKRKKPKIIALTARVMSGVKQKCAQVGMDDYITKPMEIQLLNEKIMKLLD